jgi:hypothetical protein
MQQTEAFHPLSLSTSHAVGMACSHNPRIMHACIAATGGSKSALLLYCSNHVLHRSFYSLLLHCEVPLLKDDRPHHRGAAKCAFLNAEKSYRRIPTKYIYVAEIQ